MAKTKTDKKPISQEEYTTNKVLTVFSVCLLGVLILMMLQRLLDYGSTFRTGLLAVKVLLIIGILIVLWGLWLFAREHMDKRQAARRIICGRNVVIVGVVMVLCMTVINLFGVQPIKLFYVILPALAVYYLVFHSYATEFFVMTVDTGAAVGLMFIVQRAQVSSRYGAMAYAALAVAVVLAAAQIALVARLRAKKGKFSLGGRKRELQFSKNAYTMLMVTPAVMAVLVALMTFAPAVRIIAMGASAAYLFVTAVYYTVKLM